MGSVMPPSDLESFRHRPAGKPPQGVIPNFIDPSNKNRLAIAVIIASIGLTTIAGLTRFYSRVFCTRRVRIEDYLGLLSYPFFIAGTWVLTTIPKESGFFVHQWDLLVIDLEGFLYAYVLSTILYCVAIMLAKAAIILEWTHIFVARPIRSNFYWICYGMIAANTCLYIATIITINFACNPRERIWRRYLPGSCINIDAFNLFITSFHLIFDLLMLLLPHKVIWGLGLTLKQKIGVSIVFSFGSLACAWAAGRVVSAVNLKVAPDKTYAYSQYILWGLAEVTTAELVFCVPSIPVVFKQSETLCRLYDYLQTKLIMILFPKDQSLSSGDSIPYQHEAGGHTVSDERCTWLDDGSDTGLTELEPIRVQAMRSHSQRQRNPVVDLGGILITTEIDIRTDDAPQYKTKKPRWGR